MAKDSLPTQQFIDIETFREGTVFMKSGNLRSVIMVRGINVYLKTEDEQNAIIGAFQEFLNGLDFPLEIVIHSRRLNIMQYLEKVNERRNQETSDLLRIQIDEYIAFVRDLVATSTIMSKRFYVIVPYDAFNISTKKGTKEDSLPQDFITKKYQLDQRTDVVMSGLHRLGVNAARLGTEELVELFYNLYNPQEVEKVGIDIAKRLSLI